MIEGVQHNAVAGDVAAFTAWLSAVDNRTPEQRLFLAVLARCWFDAFEPGVSTYGTGDDPEAERATARRWLTTDLEPWAMSRELVCQAAGLDSEIVKRAARKRLAEAKAAPPREAEPKREAELTQKEIERRKRRAASQLKYYRRKRAAKAAGLTLAEFDAQQVKQAEGRRKRREYDRRRQREREARREKWAAVAEANLTR